jgi:hypothetical protein
MDTILSAADWGNPGVREQLSPIAMDAYHHIMKTWHVSDEEARSLLGDLETEVHSRLENKPQRTLGADALIRISHLVAIFKNLNTIFDARVADDWPQLPNMGPIFGGKTPLAYMREGGIPAMQRVRRLLDAIKEGM